MDWQPKTAEPDTSWSPKTAEPDTAAPSSFLGDMGANVKNAVHSGMDLIKGNYQLPGQYMSTPKTEELADKLFTDVSDKNPAETAGDILLNARDKTKLSDYSNALLEKIGANPAGKALNMISGLNPLYNAAGTAINRYVNPAISKKTGIDPSTLQIMELAAGTKGGKVLAKIDPSDAVIGAGIRKGLQTSRVAGGSVKQGTGIMAKGFNAREPEVLDNVVSGVENEAGKYFDGMKGVSISPKVSESIIDHIDKTLRAENELDPDIHRDIEGVIDRMKEKAKAGFSLSQIHNQRKLLRAVENKNALTNPDVARLARDSIDHMDEALETMKIKGGSKDGAAGIESMQNGISTWAKARKFETVASVVKKAQGDPNKLKTGFKNLLNSKRNIRGFSKEEKALIKEASENTTAESLMSMIGKFGIGTSKGIAGNSIPWLPLITSFYAHSATPEMAALSAVGTAAKYGQKLMARGKAENVLNAIESRGSKAKQLPSP